MECLANLLDQKYPQLNTVAPDQALSAALYRMSCEKLDYLIVMNNNDFAGVLSEQDVAHKVFSANKPLDHLQVKDIMNSFVPVCNSNDDIGYAMQVLDCYHTRYMAVYDQFDFKGIISENDLLKKAIENKSLLAKAHAGNEFHWSY